MNAIRAYLQRREVRRAEDRVDHSAWFRRLAAEGGWDA